MIQWWWPMETNQEKLLAQYGIQSYGKNNFFIRRDGKEVQYCEDSYVLALTFLTAS
jgi:hypothetical protein